MNVVDEGIRLLVDPELIVCQMMFSSLESLPAILSAMGDCFVNASGDHNHILACNIASVDEARLIEAAVTSFRVNFSRTALVIHSSLGVNAVSEWDEIIQFLK